MKKIEEINLVTPDGCADRRYKETWSEVHKINELVELVNMQQAEIEELKIRVDNLSEKLCNPYYH